MHISTTLDPLVRDAIVRILRQYKDAFAFNPSEMLRIAPDVIQYTLNDDPTHKPVIRKIRHLEVERRAATAVGVKKPLKIGFTREC